MLDYYWPLYFQSFIYQSLFVIRIQSIFVQMHTEQSKKKEKKEEIICELIHKLIKKTHSPKYVIEIHQRQRNLCYHDKDAMLTSPTEAFYD